MIAAGFRRHRRNAIAASRTALHHTYAAFGGLAKGPALFAVPIQERAHRSFCRVLCGYFQDGSVGSLGVIISLSNPDFEDASGPRTVNVSLENVVVHPSADSMAGREVHVSSAVGRAELFSIPHDVFRRAMLSVDAELGYGLAGNSNLRRLRRGASDAAFSIRIVSSSTLAPQSSSIGLLASVLLAPGIFAFQQGSALATSRAPVQLIHHVPAAHTENIGE